MKKLLFIMLTLAAITVWAQNEITLVPAADIHNGAVAGDPAGYIDMAGKLDVSGMPGPSLLVFDVMINNLDFTLAGYEFKMEFPVNLTALSELPAEWEAGWAGAPDTATYQAQGLTATPPVQFLPANSDGTRNASTVDNGNGTYRVGMLWTDGASRPAPTAGLSAIGRVAFLWDGGPTCTSADEVISITITSQSPAVAPDADIFANDAAARVIVGSADVEVHVGNPSALVRADANHSGARTPADLIGAANCSLFGKDNVTCNAQWPWSTDPAFDQVFDYDCSGFATPADLLGNARLCLDIGNRTAFKNVDYYSVSSKTGGLTVNHDGNNGIMSFVLFSHAGLALEAPSITEQDQSNGWLLVYDLGPDTLRYAVFNPTMTNTQIPEVTISYRSLENGRIAVLDTMTQAPDLSFLDAQPTVEDGSITKLVKPLLNPVKVK